MKKIFKNPKKNIISFIIYALLFSCLVFFAFQEYLKVAGYLFTTLLIILPYYIYAKSEKIKSKISLNLIESVQLVIATAGFLNLLGSMDFYHNLNTWWYDLTIHFISPIFIFSMTPLLVILFQLYFLKKVYLIFTLIGNLLLIIFGSFFWEFFENIIDAIFTSASMFGQLGEVYYDTITDLAADFTGGLVATWLIYRYFYDYIINNIKSR